ncbi:hypothetical protein DAMA08_025760 [Martiniozyma asiatica (nom. inval.)]|nr:hypothetical protein DAMA08_025760 [Martiniozyma asiatica]
MSQSIKATEEKRRQIFKPLLANPYTVRTRWPHIDSEAQKVALDILCTQILPPIGKWNKLSAKEQIEEIEKEKKNEKHNNFKERFDVVEGYNKVMKILEGNVATQVRKQSDGNDYKVLFVCKNDIHSPIITYHIPLLCNLSKTVIVQLSKGSAEKLGSALQLNQEVTLLLLKKSVVNSNPNLKEVLDSIESVHIGFAEDLLNNTLGMNVKFALTDIPIKNKKQ